MQMKGGHGSACLCSLQWEVDTAGQFQVQGQPEQHCEYGIQGFRARWFQS